jgi:hypothetical protein
MLQKSTKYGKTTAMEQSQQTMRGQGFSSSQIPEQLAALEAWQSRTGHRSSSAERILLDHKKPMTKESFLRIENPSWDPDEVLSDPEWIEMLPDFLMELPDEVE